MSDEGAYLEYYGNDVSRDIDALFAALERQGGVPKSYFSWNPSSDRSISFNWRGRRFEVPWLYMYRNLDALDHEATAALILRTIREAPVEAYTYDWKNETWSRRTR